MPVTRIDDQIANNGDWQRSFVFEDADTGQPISLSGAYVELEIRDQNNCRYLSATTDNGMLTISADGTVNLKMPALDIKRLRQGEYPIGMFYQLNGDTVSLFVGTLSVVDGVARP